MESSAPAFPQEIYREELGNQSPHRCQLCGEKILLGQGSNSNCDRTKMVSGQAGTSWGIPRSGISSGIRGFCLNKHCECVNKKHEENGKWAYRMLINSENDLERSSASISLLQEKVCLFVRTTICMKTGKDRPCFFPLCTSVQRVTFWLWHAQSIWKDQKELAVKTWELIL